MPTVEYVEAVRQGFETPIPANMGGGFAIRELRLIGIQRLVNRFERAAAEQAIRAGWRFPRFRRSPGKEESATVMAQISSCRPMRCPPTQRHIVPKSQLGCSAWRLGSKANSTAKRSGCPITDGRGSSGKVRFPWAVRIGYWIAPCGSAVGALSRLGTEEVPRLRARPLRSRGLARRLPNLQSEVARRSGTVLRNEVQRQWQPAQHEFRVSRRSRLTSSGARWRPAKVF